MNDFTKVAARAARQAGVISHAQLLQMKLTRAAVSWLVESGQVIAVRRGIYRVPGAPESREQRLWTAVLAAGRGALVSHLSAAWLWKLDGLGLHPPAVIDVSVPNTRCPLPMAGLRLWRVKAPGVACTVESIPCTNLPRTIVDLAAVLPDVELEAALDSALRRSRFMKAAIITVLRGVGTRSRKNAQKLSALLHGRPLGASGSWLESHLRDVIKRAGLPQPIPQLVVHGRNRKQIGVFDLVWPEYGIVILGQSWRWHGSQAAQEKDERQRSALGSMGWQVLGYTARRLAAEPDAIVAELKVAIANGRPIEP